MAFRFLSDMLRDVSSTPESDNIDESASFYEGVEGNDDESDLDEEIIGDLGRSSSDEESETDDVEVEVDLGLGQVACGSSSDSEWSEHLHDVNVDEFVDYDSSLLHNLSESAEPIDYFHLFLPESFFEDCAEQTNLYAQQMQEKIDERWEACTVSDVKIFLYVNIYFGIKRLPHYAHYFAEHPLLRVEAVASVLTKARYEKLSQYFHLNNNDNFHPRGHPEHDPLFKVRPLLDLVVAKSKALYLPGRNISFDEAMVQYTGRLYFKQYIRGKPTPWGVKVWCAADPRTGYLLDFFLYTGKGKLGPNGLGYDVITTLGDRFNNRGHHFFFDNFFSSVKLAKDLLQQGTYSCSTIRPSRKGWPKDLSKKKKEPKGTTKMRQSGNLLATLWVDKRPVTVLSTSSNPTMTSAQRRTKEGPVSKQISQPIVHYNKSMGGVDLHDQYRSYYPVGRRSKKWWRCCVWFLFQVAIINSWIIYRKSYPASNKLSHLDFRLSILMKLMKGNSSRKRRRTDNINVSGLSSNDPTDHQVIRLHGRKKCCVWCRKSGQKTATNRVPETVFGCTLCQVHLRKDLCFAAYHNDLNK